MKTPVNQFSALVILIIGLMVAFNASAQYSSSPDLAEFELSIKDSGKRMELYSQQGSAWLELSLNAAHKQIFLINNRGVKQLENSAESLDYQDESTYLFTITQNKNQVYLTGIKGTAWKELSFTLSSDKNLTINQFGMKQD